jgi:hypothetical protein
MSGRHLPRPVARPAASSVPSTCPIFLFRAIARRRARHGKGEAVSHLLERLAVSRHGALG